MKKSLRNLVIGSIGFTLLAVINFALVPYSSLLNNILLFIGIGITYSLSADVLNHFLDKIFPWDNSPKRIYINMIAYTIVMGFLSIFISYFVVNYYSENPISLSQYVGSSKGKLTILVYFFISLLFTFFFHAKGFYEAMRTAQIKEKEMENAKAKTEIKMLTQQIEPHFLFNNLAVLHSFIDTEPEKAKEFVETITQNYRDVLSSQKKESNTVEEELKIAKNYFQLMQLRLGDAIRLKESNDLPMQKEILPMSLQMGIENAIKHNVATSNQPLYISINNEVDYLVVRNNLQIKKVLHSNKSGIDNLNNRYSHYDKKIITEQTDNEFIIKIPYL